MLNLFISCLFTVVLYAFFGAVITKFKKIDPINFSKIVINGVVFISCISLILNFFTPLTKEINSLLYLIIFFYIFKLNISSIKNCLGVVFGISLITYILIFASHTYRPDAGLYHLPYIKILNEEKIIFGLANLHFRYGHTSIIQYLSAINLNFFTGINGITIPSAIIAATVITNFLTKFYKQVIIKNYNFHFYFLLGVLIYIFFKMNRYSEYGNDAPAHFLTFYLISEFLILKKNDEDSFLNIVLLSVFIILHKITLLLILIIPLTLIFKSKKIFFFKKLNFYLIFFLISTWVLKNIIISGCAFYPIKFTCNEGLNWTNTEKINEISIENEAFSKGWPNYNDRHSVSQNDYIKNFRWFNTWIKRFIDEQKEKSFAFILILILILFLLILKSKNKKKINNELLLLSTLIASSFLWFIKIPDYRYIYSIIISLIIYPFALIMSKRVYTKDPKIIFVTIISIFFLIFIFKNIFRIYNTEIYFNYPSPKIFSHNDNNEELNYSYKIINNKKIYNQKNGYCMYTKPLCTPYDIDFIIENKKSYLFFFKK